MAFNPNIHHRRSIRLKGYDYSREGLYFITICVQDRACLFGAVGASLVDAQIDNDAQNDCGTNKIMGRPPMEPQIGQPQSNALDDGRPQMGQPQGIVPTDATMILNDSGKMIENEWLKLTERFTNIELHNFVIMPNHFHGILEIIDNNNGRPQGHAPTNKTVGDMLDAFKSMTTVEYIRGVKQLGWPRFNGKLWQRNYYEHIIRNEQSYNRIAEYIVNNPANWQNDKFYT